MAEGLNRVMLLGNLGADPELRMTQSGTAVLNMRLATSETYLDRNKQKQEKTEWHSIVLWGKRAEALGKFLTKGSRILVEGSLSTSSYEDRDGNKRFKTEIKASNILLQGGTRGGVNSDQSSGSPATSDGTASNDYDSYSPPDDDDIPFVSLSWDTTEAWWNI